MNEDFLFLLLTVCFIVFHLNVPKVATSYGVPFIVPQLTTCYNISPNAHR